MALLLTQD